MIIENIKQIALSQRNYDKEKKENRLRQQKAEEELMKVSFWRRRLLKNRLYYAQTYIRFREDQRFILDMHLSKKRSVYLKMGELLTEKGILADYEDVFYFDIANIEELSRGELPDVKEKVKQARIKLELYKRSIPATFFRGDTEFERKLSIKKFFEGTAASAGKVTGVARIVKTIEEIGILKALGAQSKEILLLFLTEATITGLIGGILGAIFGFVLGNIVGDYINLPVSNSPILGALVVGFAVITSVLSGLYPAWRASNLHPVEALRYE